MMGERPCKYRHCGGLFAECSTKSVFLADSK